MIVWLSTALLSPACLAKACGAFLLQKGRMTQTKTRPADAQIVCHKKLWLIKPLNGRAMSWLRENTVKEGQWFSGQLACAPEFVADMVELMEADGLVIQR